MMVGWIMYCLHCCKITVNLWCVDLVKNAPQEGSTGTPTLEVFGLGGGRGGRGPLYLFAL